jgi:hypothetical protein
MVEAQVRIFRQMNQGLFRDGQGFLKTVVAGEKLPQLGGSITQFGITGEGLPKALFCPYRISVIPGQSLPKGDRGLLLGSQLLNGFREWVLA